MDVKEYLNQAKVLDAQINRHLHELEYWRGISRSLSGCGFESHCSTSRNTEAPFVKCVGIITELEETINAEIDELVDVKHSISACIHRLDNLDYCKVLELHYLSFRTWEQIAEELGYSKSWVYKTHGRALNELDLIIRKIHKVTQNST